MRILFLCSSRRWGGNEKWVSMAASALAESHAVALAYRREVVGSRVPVPGTRLPFLAPFEPFTYRRLLDLARRSGADVLIPTKRRDYVMAGLVARSLGCRCVYRLGIVRHVPDTPWHRLVYGRLPHGIIVNAQAVKAALLSSPFIDPASVEVIYNGLDTVAMDAAVPARAPFPVTVMSVGRLTDRKAPGTLVEALALLAQAGRTDVGVVFAGDGPLRPALERQVRALGLGDRVRFPGHVTDPYPLLASARIYVTMSRNEGLSNALLEGMYLTGAVVATRAGGSGEIVVDGENGLLVDHGDAGALAMRLAQVADDEVLRLRLGKKARATVRERFATAMMRDRIVAFLDRVVSRPI
jgi:glycosyltransferase involved in cell wall biosynthesis